MLTNAFSTFKVALGDAQQLMELHDAETTAPEQREVLKRAALILAVAAWETYLEDFLQEKFVPLLNNAKSPDDLPNAFEQVAKKWLKNAGSHTAKELASWTGDQWRERIKEFFDSQLRSLNTPNSKNSRKLFKDFLGVDLETVWKWNTHNVTSASQRLDEIVSKRGTVAHEARKSLGPSPGKHVLSRQKVTSYIRFLDELAAATDKEA